MQAAYAKPTKPEYLEKLSTPIKCAACLVLWMLDRVLISLKFTPDTDHALSYMKK